MVYSNKDEKILQVICQTIGNYPDQIQYQTLNVKNLCKILENPALALDTFLKFVFDYTPNKLYPKSSKNIFFSQSRKDNFEFCQICDSSMFSNR